MVRKDLGDFSEILNSKSMMNVGWGSVRQTVEKPESRCGWEEERPRSGGGRGPARGILWAESRDLLVPVLMDMP